MIICAAAAPNSGSSTAYAASDLLPDLVSVLASFFVIVNAEPGITSSEVADPRDIDSNDCLIAH
jgi:hypothetical protein